MALKFIEELPIEGRRTFIRTDFDVPLEGDQIGDDTRVREALPTIRHAVARGARVILAAHRGAPKGKVVEHLRLEPVGARLAELLELEIIAADDCIGDGVKKLVNDMRDGQVLLLENLRFHREEESNDKTFAEKLAHLAEVYVNDAFGVTHRSHASTVGMVRPMKNRGIGYSIRKEIKVLGEAITRPTHPFVGVVGGAQVPEGLSLALSLVGKVDVLLVGGALAFPFLKAEGISAGRSAVGETERAQAAEILRLARERKIRVVLPVEQRVADLRSTAGQLAQGDLQDDQYGLDLGSDSIAQFVREIKAGKTVLWWGGLGFTGGPDPAQSSLSIAHALAETGSTGIVIGREALAALRASGATGKVSHLSMGGNASRIFLEGKPLPGISVLES